MLLLKAGMQDRFYRAIAHGDKIHRAWLRRKINEFFEKEVAKGYITPNKNITTSKK